MSSETPALAISSGPSWRCVVVAGWQASVLQSPMLTSRVTSCERVLEPAAGLAAALDAEVEDAGSFSAHVLPHQRVVLVAEQAGVVHPADLRVRLQEFGDLQRILADAVHAQASVSTPCRMRKALKGLIAAPMLRSGTTRARPM
jgi:hypothetical protein